MPGERQLMRLHLEALFTHDEAGRLVRVNDPSGGAAPRFFLGQTRDGREWRFRHDVGDETARELETLCRDTPDIDRSTLSPEPTAFEVVLAREAPVRKRWAGPAYRLPEGLAAPSDTVLVTPERVDLLLPYFMDWTDDVVPGEPFAAVVSGGRAVSICCSVRTTPRAAEAGVETAAEFRGRGYAARAVAAWGHAVHRLGRIPLYSTSWENTASRAVARKLGLTAFGTDYHLT